MNDTSSTAPAPVPALAGVLLAAGSVGFVIVFSVLAATFDYPKVLSRPAADVLPALAAGGASLRIVWAVYAILPATVLATSWLVGPALPFRRRWRALVTAAGVAAALAMMIGLARWPTLQWALGQRWLCSSDPAVHAQLARSFATLNRVFGNLVGEFIGEVALAGWLLGVGVAARRRWLGRATMALAALMWVGSLRNVVPATQWATDLTNGLLPLIMLFWGLTWSWRGWRARSQHGSSGSAGVQPDQR